MSRKSKRELTPPQPLQPRLDSLVAALLAWFDRSARDLPWRRTADPYAIWISEIMLQQTQVKTVIPYWTRWMEQLPTMESLARAKLEKVLKLWEGLGYYTRARHLHDAAKVIMTRHGGVFPSTFDDVVALPGIGRYTAGAICSIAFNAPAPIVDGNVIRVLTRLFGIRDDPSRPQVRERLWSLAKQLVLEAATNREAQGERSCSRFNQSLMELGATICSPRQPNCLLCPVRSGCAAHALGLVERIPAPVQRPKTERRRFAAFVVRRRNRYLVRRRPSGVVNSLLWEFPNVEWTGVQGELERRARECLGFESRELTLLTTIRHCITRYRIRVDVFLGNAGSGPLDRDAGCWRTWGELDRLAFTSAHRKILEILRLKT